MHIDKLVHLEGEELDSVMEAFGLTNFNTPPANFEEKDVEWLVSNSTFRTYGFTHHWCQQIILPEKYYSIVHFFGHLHFRNGFGIYTDYWSRQLKIFSFAGCLHEMRSLTEEEMMKNKLHKGRCLHHSICDKCGMINTIDSSD